MFPTDDGDALLSTEDVLEAVTAIGDRDRLAVAYAVYAHSADGLTVSEIAAEVDGPEYELTEFGRLLLEEGILALFDAAGTVDDL